MHIITDMPQTMTREYSGRFTAAPFKYDVDLTTDYQTILHIDGLQIANYIEIGIIAKTNSAKMQICSTSRKFAALPPIPSNAWSDALRTGAIKEITVRPDTLFTRTTIANNVSYPRAIVIQGKRAKNNQAVTVDCWINAASV